MMADGGDKKVLQTYLESLHYDESHKHFLRRTVTRDSFLADLGRIPSICGNLGQRYTEVVRATR